MQGVDSQPSTSLMTTCHEPSVPSAAQAARRRVWVDPGSRPDGVFTVVRDVGTLLVMVAAAAAAAIQPAARVGEWDGHRYTNAKLKQLTGWRPRIGIDDAVRTYLESLAA